MAIPRLLRLQSFFSLKEEIDLDSFVDYLIINAIISNTDWPHNNARFFAIGMEKFRFVLFDLDKVAWLKMNKSPLEIIDNKQQKNIITDLFFMLYQEESFQKQFWDRYQELLKNETLAFEKFQN